MVSTSNGCMYISLIPSNHCLTEWKQGTLDMEVAAELQKPELREWLRTVQDDFAFLGGVLSVINPAQYEAGVSTVKSIHTCLPQIQKNENLPELLENWTSPCIGMSLMSNRDSLLHRDNGASYSSMDMLASVGRYSVGRLSVPRLGLECSYNSGTVVAFAGRVIQHGATSDSERLCMSFYLRENVLK